MTDTNPETSYDILTRSGKVRSDADCSYCGKTFICELDHAIEGNHVVECPYCAHEHCRVIQGGKVTAERYDSRLQRVNVESRSVWKHDVLQIQTSTASHFIRDRWLNRSDQ